MKIPNWYYAWFMKQAEKSSSICLCGCTPIWRALYELAMFKLFKKDY